VTIDAPEVRRDAKMAAPADRMLKLKGYMGRRRRLGAPFLVTAILISINTFGRFSDFPSFCHAFS